MSSDQRIRWIRNASFATLWRSTFAGSARKQVEIYTFHVMMRGDILAFDHCPITSWWIKTHCQLIGVINLNCLLIKTLQNSSIQYQPPFPFPSWNQGLDPVKSSRRNRYRSVKSQIFEWHLQFSTWNPCVSPVFQVNPISFYGFIKVILKPWKPQGESMFFPGEAPGDFLPFFPQASSLAGPCVGAATSRGGVCQSLGRCRRLGRRYGASGERKKVDVDGILRYV